MVCFSSVSSAKTQVVLFCKSDSMVCLLCHKSPITCENKIFFKKVSSSTLQLVTNRTFCPKKSLLGLLKALLKGPRVLAHNATQCNTLQTLQHTAKCSARRATAFRGFGSFSRKTSCNPATLQHSTTPCNTLQHPATPCNTLRAAGCRGTAE